MKKNNKNIQRHVDDQVLSQVWHQVYGYGQLKIIEFDYQTLTNVRNQIHKQVRGQVCDLIEDQMNEK